MGEEVWWEDGLVTYISEGSVDPGLPVQLTRATEEKLRKFFQKERDTELGRWRWPENPDYVVYYRDHGDHFVHVFHETDTAAVTIHRDEERYLGDYDRAACAYFAAHPEPKPWHNAKPGEVWLFKGRANPAPEAFTVHRDTRNWINPFGVELSEKYRKNRPYGENHDPNFIPRRIWPEDSNDS